MNSRRGPEKFVRVIESSSYGSSSYGGLTVYIYLIYINVIPFVCLDVMIVLRHIYMKLDILYTVGISIYTAVFFYIF